jgi:hypothetical protein
MEAFCYDNHLAYFANIVNWLFCNPSDLTDNSMGPALSEDFTRITSWPLNAFMVG